MQLDLPHLTLSPPACHAPPHTPRGVVVWQWKCRTCRTLAEPQVWQVWQIQHRWRLDDLRNGENGKG
jgi:hypothetical protein